MSLKHIINCDWTSERWFQSCGRKVRITTEAKAKRKAQRYGLRAYACEFCRGFHLTSK